MGKFNSVLNQDLQEVPVLPNTQFKIGGGIFGSPAFWNGNIYVGANKDFLKHFTISNGVISATPLSQSATAYNGRGQSPSVSANGTSGGIVWAIDVSGYPRTQHIHCRNARHIERIRRDEPGPSAFQQPNHWGGRSRPHNEIFRAHRGQRKGVYRDARTVRRLRPNCTLRCGSAPNFGVILSETTRPGVILNAPPLVIPKPVLPARNLLGCRRRNNSRFLAR